MRKTKHFLQSKIIWAAAIPMSVELLNLLATQPFLQQKYVGMLSFISGVLVIIFRLKSNGEQLTSNNQVL